MAEAKRPAAVNLICGVLAARREWFGEAVESLEKVFGPVDLESEVRPFDFTDYYEAEMGAPLLRKMYSFRELMAPDNIVAV